MATAELMNASSVTKEIDAVREDLSKEIKGTKEGLVKVINETYKKSASYTDGKVENAVKSITEDTDKKLKALQEEIAEVYLQRDKARRAVVIMMLMILCMGISIILMHFSILNISNTLQTVGDTVIDLYERVNEYSEDLYGSQSAFPDMEGATIYDRVENLEVDMNNADIYYYKEVEAIKERLLEIEYEFGWVTDEDLIAIGSYYKPVAGPLYGQSNLEDLTPTDTGIR